MVRKVFFSFHYKRDVWRANVVRNSWVTKPNREAAGFIDAAVFEQLKRRGDLAVKRWINSQLRGTSVTAVLIGAETFKREWVRYEIIKSFDKKNGLLGIYIHQIKNTYKYTDSKGENPFNYLILSIDINGKGKYYELKYGKWVLFGKYPDSSLAFNRKYWGKNYIFSDMYPVYDWINDNGYENIGKWVEKAAEQAGR